MNVNDLKLSILFLVLGAVFIYWEMRTRIQKKRRGEYSLIDSSKVFSGIFLGVVLILGGLYRLILLFL
jgi:hypothetical protein